MKALLNTCLLLLFFGSISACSHEKDKLENNIKLGNKVTLSIEDRNFIDEYNKISEHLVSGNAQKFREQLKLFLPKALQIKNDQERNNILMNIYMQTEQYQAAYDLNEKLLINNLNAFNRYLFRCQLLEIMGKEPL